MNVNVKHLSLTYADGIGDAATNRKIADQFILAEDDRVFSELVALLSPNCHFSSFTGVVRGRGAAVALLENEHCTIQLDWQTKLMQLTADTFERQGRVWQLKKSTSLLKDLPVVQEVGMWWSQERVIEHIVVNPAGFVQFRSLGYRWQLGVHW
jgi:hypothetical protein